ncbi:MAG TPA: hypothetical protein VFB54_10785 [Burkholderiales bacterium]|nr:hypothetical protein [Burkholderiales bacterium]
MENTLVATAKIRAVPERTLPLGTPALTADADKAIVTTVLFIEVPGYAARSVAQQLACKQRLDAHLARVIEPLARAERIVLGTESGVAISFFGGPQIALHVLRDLLDDLASTRLASQNDQDAVGSKISPNNGIQPAPSIHAALNFGPIRLASEPDQHVNVVGDGLSVAQRLLAFAQEGQVLASRAYVETLAAQGGHYAALFAYRGPRTDAHVRDHDVFELDIARLRALRGDQNQRSVKLRSHVASWLSHRAVAWTVALLAGATLAAALSVYLGTAPTRGDSEQPHAAPLAARTQQAQPRLRQVPVVETEALIVQPQETLEQTEPGPFSDPILQSQAQPSVRTAPLQTVAPTSTRRRPARAQPRPMHAPAKARSTQPEPEPRPAVGEARAASSVEPQASTVPWGAPGRSATDGQALTQSSSKPAAGPSALVTLAISPWGEVFVDGRSMGVSPPLRELELPTGKHRIAVRNGDLKPIEQELELASNQTVRIRHKFVQ